MKKIGGEEEAAFTQVIEEGKKQNDIGELYEEAMTTIRRLKVLLEIHQEKKKAAVAEVKEVPEFSHQNDQESTKISPEAWKTPTEPDEVISGLSSVDGSKDSEPSWVGTGLEDGSKVASSVRSESRSPDLAKIDCVE